MWVMIHPEKTLKPTFLHSIPEIMEYLTPYKGIDVVSVFDAEGKPVQTMPYGPAKVTLILNSGMGIEFKVKDRIAFTLTKVPNVQFRTIMDVIFETSDEIKDNRNIDSIFKYAMEEIGELSTELNILAGHSNKQPSKDGVVGEAIDAIICLADLIRKHDPSLTTRDVLRYVENKCDKWLDKPHSLGFGIDDICPECQSVLIEKSSGVKCSQCNYWNCF